MSAVYHLNVSKSDIEQIEKFARLGMNQVEISRALGRSDHWLNTAKRKGGPVLEAWKRGTGKLNVAKRRDFNRDFVVDQYLLDRVEEFAQLGLSKQQVANNLNISPSYFNEVTKTHPQIVEYYRRGADKGISIVCDALMRKAVEGDVRACIFFLKNRSPDTWSDSQRHEIATDSTNTPMVQYEIVGSPGQEPPQ